MAEAASSPVRALDALMPHALMPSRTLKPGPHVLRYPGSIVACLVLSLLVLTLAACGERDPDPSSQVVLYSSADAEVARLIIDAFEKETGLDVLLVGDTEATKTTGLVQRLLNEKDSPRADVWWSSEPFGTIRLARAGALEPYTGRATESAFGGAGWPKRLRASDGTWYGFAQRARVIVYNTDRVKPDEAPRTLAGLAEPRFKGRVGMARPRFGTTGGHMAALAHVFGPDGLRLWLEMMAKNDLRLYDGNMSVVRAVATGELHVGLTDTDDVWAGQRNAWPVDLVYEPNDVAANPTASYPPPPEAFKVGWGAIVLPNTAALVKGGPNPEAGQRLMDFLLSERAERILAESDSHNVPVHPTLAARFKRYAVPSPLEVDLEQVADRMEEALRICDEVLAGR